MNRIIIIFVSLFILQASGKQDENNRNLLSRQGLSERNVRLDPLLRRALLRALTDLEREAQQKVILEEYRTVRSESSNENGNYYTDVEENKENEEIQKTANSNYAIPNSDNVESKQVQQEDVSSNNQQRNFEVTSPPAIQSTYNFENEQPIQQDLNTAAQETSNANPSVNPPDIVSNLIAEGDNKQKEERDSIAKQDEGDADKKQEEDDSTKDDKKQEENEVSIFKAPLVAAFTLQQDSKGIPHSVIPLIRNNQAQNQRQQILNQQFELFKQQQQQQQQLLQNPFLSSVTITPFSQPNQFSQPGRFFGQTSDASGFPSSTAFQPLVSNSIIPQTFQSPIISPQNFQASTTIAPFRNNQGFFSTLAPPTNLSPQSFASTLLPPHQEFNGVSVVPSQSFNLSPTPTPTFPPTVPSPPGFQPISIPPVTLPLQNEPRFQSPLVVPSINQNQVFLQNQEQQRIRTQFLLDEQNRQRLIEQQNRQRQIDEQNRQRQIVEEQNRQRQLEEERQKILIEQNLRQQELLRKQREEQGVAFQRSVGFSFNPNLQPSFNRQPLPQRNNFNFNIQPSQSFGLAFQDLQTRNRVNRQEAFGSTGNLGLNNQEQRNFANQNQFQSNQIFPPFPSPPVYRTIPDEHYRNFQANQQFQHQVNNFQQFRQQSNNFQNNFQDVNKKLQNLLVQSGVAAADASGQEDLNIVSKVLALNHERSDTDIQETIESNERRFGDAPDKGLGVGEIKDIEITTQYPRTQ